MSEEIEMKCLKWFQTFGTEQMTLGAAVNGIESLGLNIDARKVIGQLAENGYFTDNGFALHTNGIQRLRQERPIIKPRLSITNPYIQIGIAVAIAIIGAIIAVEYQGCRQSDSRKIETVK